MSTGPSIPPTNPPLLPWWLYVLPVLMLAGVVVALAVYARQGWHRAEGKATLQEVEHVAEELEMTRSKVEYLEYVAKSLSEENRQQQERLEAVEFEAQDETPPSP